MNRMNQMDRAHAPVTGPVMMQKAAWHPQTMDLTGARVMITGATSGIGRACAFRFQELGCHLILIGRDEDKLQSLGQELAKEDECLHHPNDKPPHQFIRLDVRSVDLIHQLAKHIEPVDILVNNAGVNLGSETADMLKSENMEKMVFTNYLAPMAFVSAFAPMMKQRGSGHIINICSTAAHDIYPNSSVYCSTKAALSAYTVAARHDLVDTPIRVTSISPGLVDTPLHEKKLGGYDQSRRVFDDIVPLYPEDIADQIIYVSTRAKHVQVADIQSYATNQSHSSCKGIPGVARMGASLGGRVDDPMQNPFRSSHPQDPSFKRERYDSYSNNSWPSYMQNTQSHEPTHERDRYNMQSNGPMRQESNPHDSYNMNLGMNRNDAPSHMQYSGGVGGGHGMPRGGGSHSPTPTNSRHDQRNEGRKDNIVRDFASSDNSSYMGQHGQNGRMGDHSQNRNAWSFQRPDGANPPAVLGPVDWNLAGPGLPGMMPGEHPGQLPGEMSYEADNQRNLYRRDASPGPDKGRQMHEKNHYGNRYRSPSEVMKLPDVEYHRNRTQPSGSNFDSTGGTRSGGSMHITSHR